MERPLVVTDPSDRAPELIREAGELAESAGVPLDVLTVISRDEYGSDSEVLETIGEVEGSNFSLQPAEYAEEVATTAITDLLSDLDVETEPIGRAVADADDRAGEILDVAAKRNSDYVFLIGSRRSPTGKAIFGDTAQRVILNFDGYTVTLTE